MTARARLGGLLLRSRPGPLRAFARATLLLLVALCGTVAGAPAQQPSRGMAEFRRMQDLEPRMDALLLGGEQLARAHRLEEARRILAQVDDLYAEYHRLGAAPDGLAAFDARRQHLRARLEPSAPETAGQHGGEAGAAAPASRTAHHGAPHAGSSPGVPLAAPTAAGQAARHARQAPSKRAAPSAAHVGTGRGGGTRAAAVPPAPALRDLDQGPPRRGTRTGRPWTAYLERVPLPAAGGALAGAFAALVAAVVLRRRGRRGGPLPPHAPANVVRIGDGLVTLGNGQHIGARAEQQDAFGFSSADDAYRFRQLGIVAAVADGMGGMAMGAQASNTAVRLFLQALPQFAATGMPAPELLRRALEVANRGVVELAEGAELRDNVGTTFAAVAVTPEGAYWISAGDTRVYLFRDGHFHQLSTDHNYARVLSRQAAQGGWSPDGAAAHADGDALTSYLGQEQVSEVDQNRRPFPLQGGDHLLVCSDGVYGTLGDDEMARVVAADPKHACENLVSRTRAVQRPAQDNMTALVLSYVRVAGRAPVEYSAAHVAGSR